MPAWKEGDQVRVVTRTVTDEDKKSNRYYSHMAGLTGSVQAVYEDSRVAIKVERVSMSDITADVHKTATERMRKKFVEGVSEEQKKALTKAEMEFDVNYVLLVQEKDLETV